MSKHMNSRRASVLLLVLVVVALFTLSSFAFFELMFNHRRAADSFGSQVQANALAESGQEYLLTFLTKTPEEIEIAGGMFDNSVWFRGILVVDDAADARRRGRFSVLAPNIINGVYDGARFGLENESARINLNTILTADVGGEGAARDLLLTLPGMTDFIADAILDWIDDDDVIREFGAEMEYYSGLQPPYSPGNGPLESIEQLLLVRGVTPELLYGADVNRNFLVDADEQARATSMIAPNSDGSMNRGWSAFLTINSSEINVRADGSPKIDVNSDDLETLHADLEEALGTEEANFIIAYRQGGATESTEAGVDPGGLQLNLEEQGREKLATILDLIGTKTSVVQEGQTDATVVESPFPDDPIAMTTYLPLLMENLSVNPSETIPGRININQAPRAVLMGIPGLDPQAVESIISLRDVEYNSARPERLFETWILSEGIVDLQQMKELMPFVTGGGDVYRAQIAGFFDVQGPSSRIEVIIDTTQDEPLVVSWRDITQLGLGFPVNTLGAGLADIQ